MSLESALDHVLRRESSKYVQAVKTRTISIGTTNARIDLYFDGYISNLISGAFIPSPTSETSTIISIFMLKDFDRLMQDLVNLLPVTHEEKPFDYEATFPFKVFLCGSQGQIYILNTLSSSGFIFLRETPFLDQRSYVTPFRLMISWIIERMGGEIVHASAIARNQKVLIISGEKGSGKSTLALQSVYFGYDLLCDDALAVIDKSAYAIYSRAKIEQTNHYTQEFLKHSFQLLDSSGAKNVLPLSSFGTRFITSGDILKVLLPIRSSSAEGFEYTEKSITDNFVRNSVRELFGGDKYNVVRLQDIANTFGLIPLNVCSDMKSNFDRISKLISK